MTRMRAVIKTSGAKTLPEVLLPNIQDRHSDGLGSASARSASVRACFLLPTVRSSDSASV